MCHSSLRDNEKSALLFALMLPDIVKFLRVMLCTKTRTRMQLLSDSVHIFKLSSVPMFRNLFIYFIYLFDSDHEGPYKNDRQIKENNENRNAISL
jgi:hypothetical protein